MANKPQKRTRYTFPQTHRYERGDKLGKRGGRKRELEEKGGLDKGEERQSETKGGRHSRGKAGHQICNWPERAPELAETGSKESDGLP